MAGATLPLSLMTDPHRDLAGGSMPISLRVEERRKFETPSHEFMCPHCKFITNSAAELSQHRWDVHPLSARLKEHLMPSPKGARKRPNSESSDDGKETESDDVAPKKKLSPAHVMMTCDFDADSSHVRRTSSADEITKLKLPEEQAKQKSRSFDNLYSSNHFSMPRARQRDEGKCERDETIVGNGVTATTSGDSNVHNLLATAPRTGPDGEGDLHTLARAALTATPLDWNKKETQVVQTSSNWLTYFGGGVVPNVAFVPGTLPQVWGHYVPETSFQSFHPGFFAAQPSFAVSGSFPPGPGFPASFPVCFPPTLSVTPPQANKLSTLSDVASRYLAGVDEQSGQVSFGVTGSQADSLPKETNSQPIDGVSEHVTPHHDGIAAYREKTQSCNSNANDVRPRSTGVRKTLPIPTPDQHQQRKKPAMDDNRLRSLEQALSQIDCCDPDERSNVLPYQCSDGKWRMVKSKCVGGAWVVHVPGAVQPSIYLPLHRNNRSQGALDNWLKEQLTSTRKPRSQSDVTEHHGRASSQADNQRCFGPATTYKTLATNGRLTVSHPQRLSAEPASNGDAIRSLLLSKSAV